MVLDFEVKYASSPIHLSHRVSCNSLSTSFRFLQITFIFLHQIFLQQLSLLFSFSGGAKQVIYVMERNIAILQFYFRQNYSF